LIVVQLLFIRVKMEIGDNMVGMNENLLQLLPGVLKLVAPKQALKRRPWVLKGAIGKRRVLEEVLKKELALKTVVL